MVDEKVPRRVIAVVQRALKHCSGFGVRSGTEGGHSAYEAVIGKRKQRAVALRSVVIAYPRKSMRSSVYCEACRNSSDTSPQVTGMVGKFGPRFRTKGFAA